jgi:glycosyltransferase involved in cell wall biosynthesis
VSDEARSRLEEHVELTGQVPRSEVEKHYEWADVFLLPSICEGSATVVYEAMAKALPVICTPNTGSIVRDEEDGFVVPIRNSEIIAERVAELRENSELYESMSGQALSRYRAEGSLDAYRKRLIRSVRNAFQ